MRSKNATTPLDHVFYALSDPTRRAMLETLAKGETNISQLVEKSRLSFAAVSKHLKVLEKGHLVQRKSDSRDGRAFVLQLAPQPMRKASDWLDKHREYWEARFSELDKFVAENYVPKKEKNDGDQ
ncbi:MAG: ArsR/SmtB family transcription factor [bacterium]